MKKALVYLLFFETTTETRTVEFLPRNNSNNTLFDDLNNIFSQSQKDDFKIEDKGKRSPCAGDVILYEDVYYFILHTSFCPITEKQLQDYIPRDFAGKMQFMAELSVSGNELKWVK